MTTKPRTQSGGKLKVRIPFMFEAEGEGAAPVILVAVLAILFFAVVCFLGNPLR